MTHLKQLLPDRSFTLQALLILLLSSFVANASEISPQTKKAQSQSALTEALQHAFGSTVEAVTIFKPWYLTGDFNGDGAQDVLLAVRIKGHRSELPAEVKLLNPFSRGAKPIFPANPVGDPTLAIAIIHGGPSGWQSSVAGKFLLFGESPILILENDRAISKYSEGQLRLMEIISKRGRRPRGAFRAPAAARGDAILFGTEAADSMLYWDGKTYRWHELEGGE
ncbi:MAG: hypothetical protein ABJC10_07215 [Acidobacteriota bacterium]